MNGDFYWMLSNGSGFWRNPATGKVEVLPVDRPGRVSRRNCTTTTTRSPTALRRRKFTSTEDYEFQTSFVIDDTAINVS